VIVAILLLLDFSFWVRKWDGCRFFQGTLCFDWGRQFDRDFLLFFLIEKIVPAYLDDVTLSGLSNHLTVS